MTISKNISIRILKWCIAACLLLSAIFFLALNNNNDHGKALFYEIQTPLNKIWNDHIVDSAISLLKSGDLVMRRGIDATSYMLSYANQRDKSYSHCGLVMIENGYPFVYHSIGGEDNPNERLRRDSASFFFSAANNLSIGIARYDMPENSLASLGKIVRQFYKEHRKFDMKFDLKTDDRLYCSEFVYKAINLACKDSNYIKPITILGFSYVGIDDLFLNPHAKPVWQVKFK